MLRNMSKSMWLGAILLAVALGIWPGIVLGQASSVSWSGILGWLIFSVGLVEITHLSGNALLTWQMSLCYPLALLGYGACAYWTIYLTGKKGNGLLVIIMGTVVSTLVAVFVAAITIGINQGASFKLNFFESSLKFLSQAGIGFYWAALVNLLISALLGWLISMLLVLLGGRRTYAKFQ